MKENIYFVSYGDSKYRIQRNRIKFQAKKFKIFKKVFIYNHRDLDVEFRKKFFNLLEQEKGGGYWIWKSQIILQTLKSLQEGDIILYVDSGSMLNINGKKRLIEYFQLLSNSNKDMLLFRMPEVIIEKNWTTNEVFKHFNVENNKEITDTVQYLGGIIFAKNNSGTVNFFQNFQKTVFEDQRIITNHFDTNQHNKFEEGRHDQSILSVMAKIKNVLVIDDESYFDQSYYKTQIKNQFEYPILTVRDGEYTIWQKIKYYSLYPLNRRKIIYFNQAPYYFKNKITLYHKLIHIILKFFKSRK